MMFDKYVVVTTKHRGVFFGKLSVSDGGESVTLTEARNCLRWGAETKGFLGLAAVGPIGNSRVGPAVPKLRLYGVTSITECTEVARAAWELGSWS